MSNSVQKSAVLEVTLERAAGSEARLEVTAPPEEVDRALTRAAAQLGSRVKLPGFRPGKAPAAVVERAVGWPALQQEAIDLLLPELYERAVRQVDVQPVASPEIPEVSLERGAPFHFTASVVIRPEVILGDYRSIHVDLETKPVPDEDIDGTLEELRQRYAQLQDGGEREVREGDVVTARLTMRHGDDLVGTPDQEQELDLQRGGLLPGMAEQLLGAQVGGEPVEVTITLPDDYSREELRGEMVTITAEVTRVQQKDLPPLDDNLAAIAGHGETLEELRLFIAEQIQADLTAQAERDRERKALELLGAMTTAEIPAAMVQQEVDRELRDMDSQLRQAGISLEALISAQGKTMEELREERKQPAADEVRLELALEEVARRESIEVDDQELDAALAQLLSRGTAADVRRRMREPLRRQMLRGKARDLVLRLARGDGTTTEGD